VAENERKNEKCGEIRLYSHAKQTMVFGGGHAVKPEIHRYHHSLAMNFVEILCILSITKDCRDKSTNLRISAKAKRTVRASVLTVFLIP
jgi:hypothetical protein